MTEKTSPRGPGRTKGEKDERRSKYNLTLKELLGLPDDELGPQVWLTAEQLDELMALPEEEIQAYYHARPEESREKDERQYELFHEWDEYTPEEEAAIAKRVAELRKLVPDASEETLRPYAEQEYDRRVSEEWWDNLLQAARLGKYEPCLWGEHRFLLDKVVWGTDELGEEEIPDVRLLIEGINLPVGASCILAGPPGAGKSWLALHMAMSMVYQEPFLGKYPASWARVLFIDEEGTPVLTGKRQNALKRGIGIKPDAWGRLVFLIKGGIRLDRTEDIDMLSTFILNNKVHVVFMDSLIRMHAGDENSARDMAIVTRNLNRLMAETGVSLLIVQHTRKYFGGARRRESVRGSSELTAFPDLVIACERKGSYNVLRCLKSKATEEFDPIAWQLLVEEDTARLEAIEVSTLDFTDQRRKAVRDLFVGLMADGEEHSRQTLLEYAKRADYGRRICEGVLQMLEEEGVVEKHRRGTGGAHFYRLLPGQLGLLIEG